MEVRDRPADPTPAMIQAGVSVLDAAGGGSVDPYSLVVELYRAMDAARLDDSGPSPDGLLSR